MVEIAHGFDTKTDNLVSIHDIDSGLHEHIVCLVCKQPLVAKKGSVNAHHFAHYASDTTHSHESIIHLFAKEFIKQEEKVTLPQYTHHKCRQYLEIAQTLKYPEDWEYYIEHVLNSQEQEFIFDHIDVEQKYEEIVPDLTAYKSGRPLFIEIKVTHPIDKKKLEKIFKYGISTVEIDLSGCKDTEDIQDFIEEGLFTKWIYNAKAEEAASYLQQEFNIELFDKIQALRREYESILYAPLRESANGNYFFHWQNYFFVIYQKRGAWNYMVKHELTQKKEWHPSQCRDVLKLKKQIAFTMIFNTQERMNLCEYVR